jgi:hypothetical protein
MTGPDNSEARLKCEKGSDPNNSFFLHLLDFSLGRLLFHLATATVALGANKSAFRQWQALFLSLLLTIQFQAVLNSPRRLRTGKTFVLIVTTEFISTSARDALQNRVEAVKRLATFLSFT